MVINFDDDPGLFNSTNVFPYNSRKPTKCLGSFDGFSDNKAQPMNTVLTRLFIYLQCNYCKRDQLDKENQSTLLDKNSELQLQLQVLVQHNDSKLQFSCFWLRLRSVLVFQIASIALRCPLTIIG